MTGKGEIDAATGWPADELRRVELSEARVMALPAAEFDEVWARYRDIGRVEDVSEELREIGDEEDDVDFETGWPE